MTYHTKLTTSYYVRFQKRQESASMCVTLAPGRVGAAILFSLTNVRPSLILNL